MSYLSDGPFNYNRFNAMDQAYKNLYEKKAKPDFLDMDKDGNKKESMKKAIKDKEVKEWIESQVQGGHDLSEYTYDQVKDIFTEGGMPPWLKGKEEGGDDDKKDDKKSDKKEGKKKDKCDCKEEVLEYLVQEGFASNEVSAEVLYNHMSEGWRDHLEEIYKGKHGMDDKEYMNSRSDAGKQIMGDAKSSGAEYSHRSYSGVGKPAKPGERQTHQGKMTPADRNELAIRKNALKKKG